MATSNDVTYILLSTVQYCVNYVSILIYTDLSQHIGKEMAFKKEVKHGTMYKIHEKKQKHFITLLFFKPDWRINILRCGKILYTITHTHHIC